MKVVYPITGILLMLLAVGYFIEDNYLAGIFFLVAAIGVRIEQYINSKSD